MVHSSKEPHLLVCTPYSSTEYHSQVDPYSDTCSPEKSNLGDAVDPLDCDTSSHENVTIVPAKACPGSSGNNRNLALEENNLLENRTASGICKQFSVTDVLCAACKQLLFQPAVLNCGHGAVQAEKQGIKSSLWPIENDFSWWSKHASKVHMGVGCDSCGMCPLIGERYKCIDCVEPIGFDLCGDCYKSPSKLLGRFNQKHTPDHRFELVQSNMLHNLVMRLVVEPAEDGSDATIPCNDAPEDPQNMDSTT